MSYLNLIRKKDFIVFSQIPLKTFENIFLKHGWKKSGEQKTFVQYTKSVMLEDGTFYDVPMFFPKNNTDCWGRNFEWSISTFFDIENISLSDLYKLVNEAS